MDSNKKIMDSLNQIEAFADLMKEHVTVLKKELGDGGASTGSARKGISEKEKAKVLAKRRKNRMKRKPGE